MKISCDCEYLEPSMKGLISVLFNHKVKWFKICNDPKFSHSKIPDSYEKEEKDRRRRRTETSNISHSQRIKYNNK